MPHEFGDDLFTDMPVCGTSPVPFTDLELEAMYKPSPECSATPTVLEESCPFPLSPPIAELTSQFWSTPSPFKPVPESWLKSTWNSQGSWATESTQILDQGTLPNDHDISEFSPDAVSSDLEEPEEETLSETDSWSEPEMGGADVHPTVMIRNKDKSMQAVDLSNRLPERTPFFYEYLNVYRDDLFKLYQNVYEFGKRHGMVYYARGPEADRNYCYRKFCEFMFHTMYNHWNADDEVKAKLPMVERPEIRSRFGWSVDLQMIDCLHSENLAEHPELEKNPYRTGYKHTYNNNPFAYMDGTHQRQDENKKESNLFV